MGARYSGAVWRDWTISSWVMVLPLLLLAWPGESEVSSLLWSEEAFSLPKSEVSEIRESALEGHWVMGTEGQRNSGTEGKRDS